VIDPARPRDLLIHDASIVDVITQSTYRGWVAIQDGRFVEVEEGDAPDAAALPARERFDARGATLQPGLIDAHMHIESSLITPRRFAEAVLPRGTTTIVQDPHEVANVLGASGIRAMIHAAQGLPLRVYSAVSSCVPATSAAIETPNASITPDEIAALAREPGVIALGEVMDFQGLIDGDAHLRAIVAAGGEAGLSLEGHVPNLEGAALSRYLAHGIRSDHTLSTPAKLREELRKGAFVMLQEKSLSPEVVAAVMALPDRSRVMLISDDVMPNRLGDGHLDRLVTLATSLGWAPLDAAAAASLRPATYFGVRDLGAIAPGYHADFLLLPAVNAFPPERVYRAGVLVADGGRALGVAGVDGAIDLPRTPFAQRRVAPASLRLPLPDGEQRATARVIAVNPINSFTRLLEREVTFRDGFPAMPDLCAAAVIPRAAFAAAAPAPTPVVGLIEGFGLQRGAWASTFAHDSHNVFTLGCDPAAMARALAVVLEAGGGMAFDPGDGRAPLLLPLPLAGLLSDAPLADVARDFDALERELRAAGARVRNPILLLTLLPLSVSPEAKLTDKGVVDVAARRILSVLTDASATP
jgi:adenine deaminase